jgi:hypothetical protein
MQGNDDGNHAVHLLIVQLDKIQAQYQHQLYETKHLQENSQSLTTTLDENMRLHEALITSVILLMQHIHSDTFHEVVRALLDQYVQASSSILYRYNADTNILQCGPNSTTRAVSVSGIAAQVIKSCKSMYMTSLSNNHLHYDIHVDLPLKSTKCSVVNFMVQYEAKRPQLPYYYH